MNFRETPEEDNDPARGPGRPRSSAADAAIRQAGWDLLAEEGARRLSLERVAARAGVAVTTVYRRYSSLDDLVLALQNEVYDDVPVPDTGSVRGDLAELMSAVADAWTPPDHRRGLLVALVAAQDDNPHVAAAYAEMLQQRRRQTTQILARGVDRGEVDASVDPDLVMELLAGLVAQRLVVSRRLLTRADALAAVDVVLGGVLSARGGENPT